MNAGTVVVRGEEELFARTAHLFATAGEISCAARDLHTFATARPHAPVPSDRKPSVRKLYRPAVLLDPSMAQHVRSLRGHADIRVTTADINETIILDRRFMIVDTGVGGSAGAIEDGSAPAMLNTPRSLAAFEALTTSRKSSAASR